MIKYFKSWFDFKTKVKRLLRSIFYTSIVRVAICYLLYIYLNIVYYTSRKNIIGMDYLLNVTDNKEGVLLASWHSRLIMIPFIGKMIHKVNGYNFYTLSSKHGDGKMVGKIMEFFGFINISGSTQDGRKSSRGIDLASMRKVVTILKEGNGMGITPDGPKGPNQKINGQLIEIAATTSANIVPVSYYSSNFVATNSWDKFRIPLPFSSIKYVIEKPIKVNKEQLKNEKQNIIKEVEVALDNVQLQSEK